EGARARCPARLRLRPLRRAAREGGGRRALEGQERRGSAGVEDCPANQQGGEHAGLRRRLLRCHVRRGLLRLLDLSPGGGHLHHRGERVRGGDGALRPRRRQADVGCTERHPPHQPQRLRRGHRWQGRRRAEEGGLGLPVSGVSRLPLAAVVLLAGCVSTRVESTWTNPAFPARKIQSFAVFGYTGLPPGRIAFEETLTNALRRRGLDAIPGYNFVTYDEWPSRDEILRRLAAKGVQAALISKVARRSVSETINPVVVGGAVSSGWDA